MMQNIRKRLKTWLRNDFYEIIFSSFLHGFSKFILRPSFIWEQFTGLHNILEFDTLPPAFVPSLPSIHANPLSKLIIVTLWLTSLHYVLLMSNFAMYTWCISPLLGVSLLQCYFPFSYNYLHVQWFQISASSDTSESLRRVSSAREI